MTNDYYSPAKAQEKFNQCIELVRKWMGEPANKLARYNPNANEKDKFYVQVKQQKLEIIRNKEHKSQTQAFVDILENKSGNCGEYEILTNVLLQLKGFSVLTCVEDWGNDNHAYSIVKFGDEYFSVDAWNQVVERNQTQPQKNKPQFTKPTGQAQNPLTTTYFKKDLVEDIETKAVGASRATQRINDLKRSAYLTK